MDFKATALHTKDVSADGREFLTVLKSREKQPAQNLTVITDRQARSRNSGVRRALRAFSSAHPQRSSWRATRRHASCSVSSDSCRERGLFRDPRTPRAAIATTCRGGSAHGRYRSSLSRSGNVSAVVSVNVQS